MTDKLIASIEAESAVIGALIIDNDKFDEIATLLRSDDFYVSAHKVLFEGVSHLLTQGKPADILTLEQYFKDKKLIEQIGGLAYLQKLFTILLLHQISLPMLRLFLVIANNVVF